MINVIVIFVQLSSGCFTVALSVIDMHASKHAKYLPKADHNCFGQFQRW